MADSSQLLTPEEFGSHCETAFAFLTQRFQFTQRGVTEPVPFLVYQVRLQGVDRGVEITYDRTGPFLDVSLCRLSDGEFPGTPPNRDLERPLDRILLEELVRLRAPKLAMSASRLDLDGRSVSEILRSYAHSLQTYGSDFLSGDLRVFFDSVRIGLKARGPWR